MKLQTKARGAQFSYEQTAIGVAIEYGQSWRYVFAAQLFARMLVVFRGRKVKVGASRDNPPRDSLGAWLQEHVTKTAIANYVAAILVQEGHAVWVDKYTLRFNG